MNKNVQVFASVYISKNESTAGADHGIMYTATFNLVVHMVQHSQIHKRTRHPHIFVLYIWRAATNHFSIGPRTRSRGTIVAWRLTKRVRFVGRILLLTVKNLSLLKSGVIGVVVLPWSMKQNLIESTQATCIQFHLVPVSHTIDRPRRLRYWRCKGSIRPLWFLGWSRRLGRWRENWRFASMLRP